MNKKYLIILLIVITIVPVFISFRKGPLEIEPFQTTTITNKNNEELLKEVKKFNNKLDRVNRQLCELNVSFNPVDEESTEEVDEERKRVERVKKVCGN